MTVLIRRTVFYERFWLKEGCSLERDFPTGYSVSRELGEGSMGRVWLASSARGDYEVAIKILNLKNDRRGSAERSFYREVRAMARLDHPGVIEVYDFGRTPLGSPFVAMELVSGTALNPYMRGDWTWGQLWNVISNLLSALGHAHARDIVHRDLKPGNVIILPEKAGPGSLKLADFGIALAMSDAQKADRRIEGTPAYIAPEAASANVAEIGPWTDIYSLGVMLFEIITGDLPYRGRHLLSHHQTSPLPQLKRRPEVNVPDGLLPIVAKMLEKQPAHRYKSVAQVLRAISALGTPTPQPLPEKTFRFLDDSYDEPTIGDKSKEAQKGASTQSWYGRGLVHLREPRIVGREAAQDALTSEFRQVLEGNGPRVVIVEGDAGSGKSKLVNWLREQITETGEMDTIIIRSEPQSETGGGLRQAILEYLGTPMATRETTLEQLRECFRCETDAINGVDALWPGQSEREINLDVQGQHAAHLIQGLIGDTPTLIWADDAQWSPEGQILKILNRLGRPDGTHRLLIVTSLRPSDRATVKNELRELNRLPHLRKIRLGPVSPFILADALDRLAPLPDGLSNAAAMMAAGNPLIALEAIRTFLEDEGLGSAPSDPNAVLRKRIMAATGGAHGTSLHRMLARATLLGRSFTLRSLARLCAVDGDPAATALSGDHEVVERLLEDAVNAGLLIEQEGKRWRFSHDLIRTELRKDSKTLPNWGQLNLEAADMRKVRAESDPTGIELEVVARHHWEARAKTTALKLGLRGLSRLHSSGMMGHATSFAKRLLKWNDECNLLTPSDKGELLLLASIAAEHSGQPRRAQQYASDAVSLARDQHLDALGARAAGRMGVLRLQQDDAEAAEKWLWDALRFARQVGDSRASADVHLSLGFFYQRRGDNSLAMTAYEMSLEIARDQEFVETEFAARSAVAGLERIRGNLSVARDAFEKLSESALANGLEVASLNARLQLGLCAWTETNPDEARHHFEEVQRGARGNLYALEFYSALGLAWCFAMQKEWHEVEVALMQAEELRFDVRLKDPEAERLRVSIFDLAKSSSRHDLVERLNKLDVLTSRSLSEESI